MRPYFVGAFPRRRENAFGVQRPAGFQRRLNDRERISRLKTPLYAMSYCHKVFSEATGTSDEMPHCFEVCVQFLLNQKCQPPPVGR